MNAKPTMETIMVALKAVATAALLATTLVAPVAAQAPGGPDPRAGSGAAPGMSGTSVSPALVTKTGAALRQVTEIRQSFAPRVAAAKSDDEKQTLQQQAMDKAVQAINDQGLSVDQYNQVIRLAQSDPQLEQQLVAAAKGTK
jgi:hypothetical protein